MNHASVRDRAQPLIDIRMAIGANLRAILTQFLLKALVISIMDGLRGVAIGIGGAWAVSRATGTVVVFVTFATARNAPRAVLARQYFQLY